MDATQYLKQIGAAGGSKKSRAKSLAARENLKKARKKLAGIRAKKAKRR